MDSSSVESQSISDIAGSVNLLKATHNVWGLFFKIKDENSLN